MLWATVTTQFTNYKCALVVQSFCLRTLWYECMGSGCIQASVSQSSPPWASAVARRANQLHATPTDNQQFSRLHYIHRLFDSQTKVPFVYKESWTREPRLHFLHVDLPRVWTSFHSRPLNIRQHCGSISDSCRQDTAYLNWWCGRRWNGRGRPQSFSLSDHFVFSPDLHCP